MGGRAAWAPTSSSPPLVPIGRTDLTTCTCFHAAAASKQQLGGCTGTHLLQPLHTPS